MKYKLAILTSHPIQYQAPLFKKIIQRPEIDLTVYFCWDFGKEESYDPEFGKKIKWDTPLFGGYNYKFLKNYSLKPSSEFWGQINPGIISEIYNNEYDAIIVFGWNSFTNWLAYLAAFILRVPVFLRGENPLNQEFSKSKLKLKIKKIILGTLFKFIKSFLYIGEENKKFYKYYGVSESKLVFVPYAIDNERFIKSAQDLKLKRKDLRKEMEIGDKDIVIIFVGKLIEKKRPFDLLKAYEKLISQSLNYPVVLLFVGDGVLREALKDYARNRGLGKVVFAGFRNQTELPKYYSMADIFVLPSGEGETWGLVVNEAMCFSLPIIISDVVGSGKDLVRNNENGYIFKIGNIEELGKCFKNLVIDKEKMALSGKKSFEIIKDYSFEKDIEGILTALKLIK